MGLQSRKEGVMSDAQLNETVRNIWDANAEWWDEKAGEGLPTQVKLIAPATERLLNIQPGQVILDIACGNGGFSRRMAALGARVVAFDFSAKFIERARTRTAGTPYEASIEYKVIDATDRGQLQSLGEGGFDGAVATMALMDMAEIDPLLTALTRLLKPGAPFVFSVTHPCFNSEGTRLAVEQETRDGQLLISTRCGC
jgi:2-polyprenyl-3-methyl-5-hydroxy-6-metoxy-1,4-benzoquinol methylase